MSQEEENPQVIEVVDTEKGQQNAENHITDGSNDNHNQSESEETNENQEDNQSNQNNKDNDIDCKIQKYTSAPNIQQTNLVHSISTNVHIDMKEFEKDRNEDIIISTENFAQINQQNGEVIISEEEHSKEPENENETDSNEINSTNQPESNNQISNNSQNNEVDQKDIKSKEQNEENHEKEEINSNELNQQNENEELNQQNEVNQNAEMPKNDELTPNEVIDINQNEIKQKENSADVNSNNKKSDDCVPPPIEIPDNSTNLKKQAKPKSKSSFSKTAPVSHLRKSTPSESPKTPTSTRSNFSKSMKIPKTARSPMAHSHRLFEASLKSPNSEQPVEVTATKPRKKVQSRISTDAAIKNEIERKRNRQKQAEDEEIQEIENSRHQLSSYNQKLAEKAIAKGFGQPKIKISLSDNEDDSENDDMVEKPHFKYSQAPPEYIEHIRNFMITHPKSRINDPNRNKNTRK